MFVKRIVLKWKVGVIVTLLMADLTPGLFQVEYAKRGASLISMTYLSRADLQSFEVHIHRDCHWNESRHSWQSLLAVQVYVQDLGRSDLNYSWTKPRGKKSLSTPTWQVMTYIRNFLSCLERQIKRKKDFNVTSLLP